VLGFFLIGVIVLALTWCIYRARKDQVEDFRTWFLVEGIPVAFVTFLVLCVVWFVISRL